MKKNYLLNNYNRYEIEFIKGEGAYLYDSTGKKYLDFLSGIAVTAFGHNHELIKKSLNDQIEKVWHTSNLFGNSLQNNVAKKLCEMSGLHSVFFCNSGTEANEAAIKFARKYGGKRFKIITAVGGFHGRTMGSLSASAQEKLWEGFHPLTPGFVHVPYNNIKEIENSIDSDTIAIMVEPIQGENGIMIPDKNYLISLRKICDEHEILLILDEVQTGIGRSGKFFAYQWEDILPDIITLAKGIANGIPLGATLCSEKISNAVTVGSHGSTFGGNYLALAASEKVLELLNEDLLININELGKILVEKVFSLELDYIKEIRYKGLMIGIEIKSDYDSKKIISFLLRNGLVTGASGNNTIRILPPFIINYLHVDEAIAILKLTKNAEQFIS